jgi:hypothetical protein
MKRALLTIAELVLTAVVIAAGINLLTQAIQVSP